jgi:hypothetical protein
MNMETETTAIAELNLLSINQIAYIIQKNWVDKKGRPNINYAAKPYVEAMATLESITDKYFLDDGSDIVTRFLCNANSWRGEVTKAVKAELKARLHKLNLDFLP